MDKLIQSYEVTKQIGAGGMATVFMGRHPTLHRSVAIKVVKGDQRDKVKRFEREAILSASLKQENLPAIYDYFIDGKNNHCLVMEYVEGVDVSEILKQDGSLPPYLTAIIVREVARGLEHLHEKGIIHRDIKPSNVRLSRDGQIKLMDFGIAKQEESEVSKNLTSTGIIIGTPSYMSPEQASGDKLTIQSDLFSLGIMMYEMLAGQKPFIADTNLTLISLIAQCRYQPLTETRPDVPAELSAIVHRCMTKDLQARYEDAGPIVRDCNRYLESISQSEIKAILLQYSEAVTRRDRAAIDRFRSLGRRRPDPGGTTEGAVTTDVHAFLRSARTRRRRRVIGWAAVLGAAATVLLYLNFFTDAEPVFGRLNLALKSDKWNALPDTRLFVNDREVTLDQDGAMTLNHFQKGRNSVRMKFPLFYQVYEYNFNLDEAGETRDLSLDLDKMFGVLDQVRPDSRKIGFVVDSRPPGAFVYLNNDFKNVFSKTPSPQTWPNLKPGVHRLSFQKEGFRTVELDRFFQTNECLSLQVELSSLPKKK